MKDRELHKFYLCVLIGRPKLQSGILKDYLIKDEKKNTVRIYKSRCRPQRKYAQNIEL